MTTNADIRRLDATEVDAVSGAAAGAVMINPIAVVLAILATIAR
ncbi:MAG: hypothetical protein AB7F78_03030 [Hyphomicrobiaceae bacterium]